MDRSSNSNPNETIVTHLDWDVKVNFDKQKISATAIYTIKVVKQSDPNKEKDDGKNVISLDTSALDIQYVKLVNDTDKSTSILSYILHPVVKGKEYLGQHLEIAIPPTMEGSDIIKISIEYETTEACTALQWLPPPQTVGKKYPYMFSQCQAIHARSLVPCQDCCGAKFSYTAKVTVPAWATCVMSALLQKSEEIIGTSNGERQKVYTWDQPVPISSYLLALAVGDLTKKDMSNRCAIWSEPGLVEAAANEFAETEQFLSIAEEIAGKEYVWGRYDLLCLPNSFPYGGMENPCLTFVTPTLLAGDRSLADVVAHEIAHSWTGNLVTNATWDHFWLNEGWTTWFQRKIMGKIKNNPNFFDFDAIDGRKHLQDAINEMPPENSRLVLDIGDDDPDDSYSAVAYEKGFTLLLYLERLVGTNEFETFFKAYVNRFASKTLTSTDFKEFFIHHFKDKKEKIEQIDWETWFHGTGMPPIVPELDQSMAKDSQRMADLWYDIDRKGQVVPTENEMSSWSSLQLTCFLDALQLKTVDKALKVDTMEAMNQLYHFASSNNSEVLFRYCQLAIAAEDKSIIPIATRFVTTQGRMKFTRPLYRALHKSQMANQLAVTTFLQHKDFYHPICSKMVAQDLKVTMMMGGSSSSSSDKNEGKNSTGSSSGNNNNINPLILVGVVAAVGTLAIVLIRRRK